MSATNPLARRYRDDLRRTGGVSAAEQVTWLVVFGTLVLIPILTSIYLGRALRRAERVAQRGKPS